MSQSDRLFLEDCSTTLLQRLTQKLVDAPDAQLPEQDIQDFEVSYSLATEGSVLKLQVRYPHLADVLKHGSQGLLERVWEGLPLKLSVDPEGVLFVDVDSQALVNDDERRRCAQQLAATRMWLLIGPLVDRLRWLRDATAVGDRAPAPPSALALVVRPRETCWIICKPDRVLVIMSIRLDDEVDVALGRAFCQEFAEATRKPIPCSFSEPKDPPADLRTAPQPTELPNVGYLTMTFSDQCVNAASRDSDERLHALARPMMTFRGFFQFHLKNAKSQIHSRLRKRLDVWQQQLNRARRQPRKGQEKRRLVSGKEFVPPPRSGGGVSVEP